MGLPATAIETTAIEATATRATAIRAAVAGLSHELRSRLGTGRELAEARRRAPEDELLPTGTVLDRFLQGGLRRGETVELVGDRSSGRFSLVVACLATVTAGGEPAALVDLGDGLDPRSAAAAGVDLARLLWVRPRQRKEAMMAAEAVVASGLPLVVVDLGLPPLPGGRGAEASWLRLARSAREQRSALVVASPYRVSGTAAQVVVEARHLEVAWRGGGGAPRLLAGLEGHLELVKDRQAGVPDRAPELLPLRFPECPPADSGPASAAPAAALTPPGRSSTIALPRGPQGRAAAIHGRKWRNW